MSVIDRITMSPDVCGSRPCVRGLRVRVKDVLDLLATGATRDEILADYPYLEAEDIVAVLELRPSRTITRSCGAHDCAFSSTPNSPPALARFIESRSHNAEHVADLGLETAPAPRFAQELRNRA